MFIFVNSKRIIIITIKGRLVMYICFINDLLDFVIMPGFLPHES